MKKPNYKHIFAVKHAQTLLKKAAKRLTDIPAQDGLLTDAKLLGEVAVMLQHQIANPTLPFGLPDEASSIRGRLSAASYISRN